MKPTLQLILICCLPFLAQAQDGYFQQQVDYKIQVQLDDEAHLLHGFVQMDYHNNAPQALDTLYIHLWPNAYRNRQTAYAKQALRMGNADFYFAPESERGSIDSLAFQLDGQAVDYAYHPEHVDIAYLVLPEPIPSGGRVTLSTPFRVDIPYCFSRLGHVGQSYQITQWYPKPAVYDQDGWHPMPYLDMGEFYSEFGDFEVEITLPENYRVAATGQLETPSERAFLQQLSDEKTAYTDTLDFPPSASNLKTIRYTAERVHDFAWFADKRFEVRVDTVQLASGRTVEAWAFFTQEERELWLKATDYVKRSVRFYSEQVGEYPYPQATAVQTALEAGGGMEYPMITNIGEAGNARSLDQVITHEVGHNWFYGILGSNERTHAWMDEGLNSYYEQRYMRQFYGSSSPLPAFLMVDTSMTLGDIGYLYQARRRLDQAPDTHSDAFEPINYFLGAYEKPAMALHLLEDYWGRERFDAAMQAYYDQWQFKHPQPADYRRVMETIGGEELGWLFDGLLYSNGKTNYSIQKVKQRGRRLEVRLRNKGDINSPVPLGVIKGGQLDTLYWLPGFEGEQEVRLSANGATGLQIDPQGVSLELYRRNDEYELSGLLPKWDWPGFKLLTAVQGNRKQSVFAMPIVSWNNYDKTLPGLLLYNHSIPEQRFEFALAPMIGVGTGRLAGIGDLHYNFYPGEGGFIHRMRLGVSGRRFGFRRVARFDQDLAFNRIQPYLRLDFKTPSDKRWRKQLLLSALWIEDQESNGGPLDAEVITRTTFLQRAELTLANERVVSPYTWHFAVEHQAFDDVFGEAQRYVKAEVTWEGAFNYAEKEAVHLRLFGGYFLQNTQRTANNFSPAAFNLISQGFNDYRYDDLYAGRSENEGFWSRQISMRDGGFKNIIGQGFPLGRSNDYILSANFWVDLPQNALFGIPIKPYLDLGYFSDARPISGEPVFSDQFIWSGGMMISAFNDAVAVYFPLLSSLNIADRQAEVGDYWQRISFQFDLKAFHPWEQVDRIRF
jgi:hypothetical protein